MSDRELRDRIASLEAAIVKLDQRLTAVTVSARDLALAGEKLARLVERLEVRPGWEA